MEEREDDVTGPRWHTVVAAVFALAVAGAIAWVGWGALSSRLVDDEVDPGEVAIRFETAIEEGRDEGLRAEAAGDPEAFFALLDTALEPLGVRDLEVDVGPLEVDDATGSAPLTWTLVGGAADGTSWESTLDAVRRRGAWQPVLDATTLHPSLRPGWSFDVEREETTRGAISGYDGQALTSGGEGIVIGIAPGNARSPDRLLAAWSENLPETFDDVQELLDDPDVNPEWFYPIVTLSQSRFDEVWTELRAIPGVLRRDDADASATSTFARHVLGRVDEPTAEMIDQGAVPGQPIGLYGLEALYEDRLVGGESAQLVIREQDGDVHEVVAELGDDPSEPVVVTLDRAVQDAVEDALRGVDEAVSVVVLDTADAAVRASASRPLEGYNRAWAARYPPGDAVLPVAVDALVSAGTRMGEDATCPRDDAVAGAQLTAPRPGGVTSVAEALGQGCDTTLGALAADLDDGVLTAAAERLGYGTTIELPLEVAATQFPPPRDTTERVRAATGQAQVLTSPLHVASTLAAAVTGTWRAPYLMADDTERPSGTPLSTGTGGAMLDVIAAGVPVAGVPSLLGTAERRVDGAFVTDAWAMTVVDDLAVVVHVEDAGREEPAAAVLEQVLAGLP